VDYVQWTGPSPEQDTSNFQTIDYKHDVYGRRSEKKVDGFSTRYLYDGDHVIAEYDGNNNLLRKYIYGPGIDQPVCMIEVADSNAVYYYHFDALGSVVALSDSAGDTVQTYEYSVYGQVAVEDTNPPNPYMFAGRRFDIEIGLYYNRARYYNPYTGRFLQTDLIGYNGGMNLYAYCGNNSLNYTDPSGLILRDREPDDVLIAVIFTGQGYTYGLVGDWDIEDVYGRFNAQPQEITTYNIDGMTVFVEEDDGDVHLDNPYPNDSSLVSVWLSATTIAYYRDAVAGAEPVTAEPPVEEPPVEEPPSGVGHPLPPRPPRIFPGPPMRFFPPIVPHVPRETPEQRQRREENERRGRGDDNINPPPESPEYEFPLPIIKPGPTLPFPFIFRLLLPPGMGGPETAGGRRIIPGIPPGWRPYPYPVPPIWTRY